MVTAKMMHVTMWPSPALSRSLRSSNPFRINVHYGMQMFCHAETRMSEKAKSPCKSAFSTTDSDSDAASQSAVEGQQQALGLSLNVDCSPAVLV